MLPMTTLAEQANRHHADAQDKARQAWHHALECGRLLTQAKAQVAHGKWSEWLADNFDGSDRHARRYVMLAERFDALPDAKRTRVASLPSLRQALEAVADDESKQEKPASNFRPFHSRPAEHLKNTFTLWPEMFMGYALLLTEAGKTVDDISEATGIDRHLVIKAINPERPQRQADKGSEGWLTLHRNEMEALLNHWKGESYRRASFYSVNEGYPELKQRLSILSEHYEKEAKRFSDELIKEMGQTEKDCRVAVSLLATRDARYAAGIDDNPVNLWPMSVDICAMLHFQEVYDQAAA